MTTNDNLPPWPASDPWPEKMLPPPVLTIELSVLELETLIEHHEAMELAALPGPGQQNLFHHLRASYLRQRIAAIAPEPSVTRLQPT